MFRSGEHQVLKQMSKASLVRAFVPGTHTHHQVKATHSGLVITPQQQGEPVGQNPTLKIGLHGLPGN